MGAIGGLLGISGGASGTGYARPELANIKSGLNDEWFQGAQNQSQAALDQQKALVNALQQQGGLQNQSSVFNQLQGVANGTGPNPAQAMLNQATGANVANQAALMAGQRGAGANVGLMARQAAQQGAGIQQQAVGQGATMQANQSLGALGQMSGIANTQAANQIGATQAMTGAAQNQQVNLLNALTQQNQANVSNQSSVNTGNAALAAKTMEGQQALLGGLMGAAGSVIGLSNGGTVPPANTPKSSFGQFLHRAQGGLIPQQSGKDMVDVVLSPGEKVVPPNKVGLAAQGRLEAKTVPGKAKVAGDSLKNDTYQTKLPEGSIVVPRTKSKDPRDSAAFVRKTLAKRRKK